MDTLQYVLYLQFHGSTTGNVEKQYSGINHPGIYPGYKKLPTMTMLPLILLLKLDQTVQATAQTYHELLQN
jgi:hypothetical protein